MGYSVYNQIFVKHEKIILHNMLLTRGSINECSDAE